MIPVKTPTEIEWMREAGRINALAHLAVKKLLEPGIATRELDAAAEQVLAEQGGRATFRNLYEFPGAICVSINEQIGHGIPGDRRIREGDVVKIDIGVEYQGFHSDCAKTYIIGSAAPSALKLVNATKEALYRGISQARPGSRCSDISHAIFETASRNGLSIVRCLYGHGVGQRLHEDPNLVNFGPPNRGPRLRPGMVVAIEPIVTNGSRYIRILEDGWTSVTVDGSFSAHFEHTVLIAEEGPEILTDWTEVSEDTANYKFRPKISGEEPILIRLSEKHMNPILIEAWGRKVDPREIFLEGSKTMVIETEDSRLAGFYNFIEDETVLHLNVIVIDTPYQGTGVAESVMRELEQTARQRSCSEIRLNVQTNNSRAIRFYEKMGFVQVAAPFLNTIPMSKKVMTTAKNCQSGSG